MTYFSSPESFHEEKSNWKQNVIEHHHCNISAEIVLHHLQCRMWPQLPEEPEVRQEAQPEQAPEGEEGRPGLNLYRVHHVLVRELKYTFQVDLFCVLNMG